MSTIKAPPAILPDDPKLAPTAYVTDERNLFEVMGIEPRKIGDGWLIVLLNCATMHRATFEPSTVLRYRLVKAAVRPPAHL